MAVATREFLLFIGGEAAEPVSADFQELAEPATGLYLETRSVVVSTGARPINPFGL